MRRNKPRPLPHRHPNFGCVYLGTRSLARPASVAATFTAADCGQMCERGNAARRRRHITGAACTPPAGQDRAAFWVMEATSLKRGVREGGSVFVNNYLLPARRLPGTFCCCFFLWFLDGEGGRRRMGRGDSAPWMDGSSSSTVASLSWRSAPTSL